MVFRVEGELGGWGWLGGGGEGPRGGGLTCQEASKTENGAHLVVNGSRHGIGKRHHLEHHSTIVAMTTSLLEWQYCHCYDNDNDNSNDNIVMFVFKPFIFFQTFLGDFDLRRHSINLEFAVPLEILPSLFEICSASSLLFTLFVLAFRSFPIFHHAALRESWKSYGFLEKLRTSLEARVQSLKESLKNMRICGNLQQIRWYLGWRVN